MRLVRRSRARRQNSTVTRSLTSATGISPSHIRADDSTHTPLPWMPVMSRTMRAPSGSRCTPRSASAFPSGTSDGGAAGSSEPGMPRILRVAAGSRSGTTSEDTSAATRPVFAVRSVPVRWCPSMPGLAWSSKHSVTVSLRSARLISSMRICSPASSSNRTSAGLVLRASSAATDAAVGASLSCGPGGGASWSTVWAIAPSFAALPRSGCTRISRISLISPHSRSLRAGSVSGLRSQASVSYISKA